MFEPTWTDCDEAGDYVVPNVLSPRDLVSRPDNMDETVPHTHHVQNNIQEGSNYEELSLCLNYLNSSIVVQFHCIM